MRIVWRKSADLVRITSRGDSSSAVSVDAATATARDAIG
jgi:hypothetical protein